MFPSSFQFSIISRPAEYFQRAKVWPPFRTIALFSAFFAHFISALSFTFHTVILLHTHFSVALHGYGSCMMVGVIAFTCLGTVLLGLMKVLHSLMSNISKVKKTGLPYVVGPFMSIGHVWMALGEILHPLLSKVPIVKSSLWLATINRQNAYQHPRVMEEKYGDTYYLVTPFFMYLMTSNAELISQVTTRKVDFRKPVEGYTIVNLFGKSILTQEGSDWRRHRKIVGPSFSEKSNRLVFEESLRQAEGMLALWASQGNNTKEFMKVENAAEDTATLSLHVIMAAGFGIPQLWPNEDEEKLEGKGVPGFSEPTPSGNHKMTFGDSLIMVLKNLPWFIVLPPKLLGNSPFRLHKRIHQAYYECMSYFEELLAIKKRQILMGEHDKGTMDLLGPMIKANEEESQSESKSQYPSPTSLSKSEILGNSFIFLFAGHETTANNIFYSILELAMELPAQRCMQNDIDEIIGDKQISELSYYTDMPRLYNSMVGAVLHEELRLIPAIILLPKTAVGDQIVTIDGKQIVLPADTFIHMNVVGVQRNPRYWPQSPDEFMPERWLPPMNDKIDRSEELETGANEDTDGLEKASFEVSNATSLLKPVKGSYIPFSDGTRGCPGKRFAQVESTAVLSAIFQKYSVELDVSEWASDEEIENMSKAEKAQIYGKAIRRAKELIGRSEQMITVQLLSKDKIPIHFVERGKERFAFLMD